MGQHGTERNRPSDTQDQQDDPDRQSSATLEATLGGKDGGSGQGGSTSGGLSEQDGPTSEDKGGAMGPGGSNVEGSGTVKSPNNRRLTRPASGNDSPAH
jgi:hypothetical protein